MSASKFDPCPDHTDGHHRFGPMGECMGLSCTAQSKDLHPCRSPYCECGPGACTHPGFRDAATYFRARATKFLRVAARAALRAGL